MIRWCQNPGQNLKMFPFCLIMPLTGVLPTWTDTVLSAWCSAYRSGKRTKFPGFRFRSVIVCGQSRNQNLNWLLYRRPPCHHKSVWQPEGTGICNCPGTGKWEKKTFFQYGFSGTATDFLCLAGEGTPEPYRQFMDEIYSAILWWIPLEHRNQLLWTENVLVAVQLHGKEPERNRTDGKPDQYRILCYENSAISGQKFFDACG